MKKVFFYYACMAFFPVFILLISYYVSAQDTLVSRKVTNTTNEPPDGATVRIKCSKLAAKTNEEWLPLN